MPTLKDARPGERLRSREGVEWMRLPRGATVVAMRNGPVEDGAFARERGLGAVDESYGPFEPVTPEPAPNAVRVRIAVAVTEDKAWAASGRAFPAIDYPLDEKQAAREAAAIATSGNSQAVPFVIRWVEADVEPPQPQTIQGAVVPAEGPDA